MSNISKYKPEDKIDLFVDNQSLEYRVLNVDIKIELGAGIETRFVKYKLAPTKILQNNNYLDISEYELLKIVINGKG